MKFINNMKKIIFTFMMMLLINIACIGNTINTNFYDDDPIKIENIQEAFVNVPARVIWFQTNDTNSNDFINIRSNDKYLLKHIQYKIDGDKIFFNTDIYLDDKYDFNTGSPINICIYSKNNIQIKTNKKDLLILHKNNKVLTNEK